jgi:uncharacterized metal-binding protein
MSDAALPPLILACSGGSDVGEIADHTARALARQGSGKMFCLAGIGGDVLSIVKTAERAEHILAIDGCPLECAAACLKRAGIGKFRHLRLAEMGLAKGLSPATETNVARAAGAAMSAMQF